MLAAGLGGSVVEGLSCVEHEGLVEGAPRLAAAPPEPLIDRIIPERCGAPGSPLDFNVTELINASAVRLPDQEPSKITLLITLRDVRLATSCTL